ncbi:MAG: hypothetical protein KDC34_16930 [Saprospiraceae bacterium]|nr:hypothetical protein [Saprospiraceae bacterium]
MNKSLAYIFTTILFLSAGCSHITDNFDGPNLVDRFGEFNLVQALEVSQPTVDFAAGETVFFTAQFNKNVNWVVVITGMESGAVKRIEGFDRELTAANATWKGGTTDLPFFRAEMCTVELLVPEEAAFSNSGEVETLSTKTYGGSLFTDFETDPGSAIEFGNYEFELTNASGRQTNMTAAQGDYYYLLEGTDAVVPNFFVGLINIKSSITGETYAPLPTTVPEELYFNCFIYADGGPYGIAVIQFVYDSNDSGAFEDGQDATFQVEGDFPINWEGWQQISHPMSAVGMSQEQLEKLVAIRVLLISDMNSQPSTPLQVDFGIDYLTFTAGGPLEL